MKSIFLKIAAIFSLGIILLSFEMPKGWIAAGSKPKSYEMGIVKGEGRDGKNCATVKSVDRKINGFGTLMQMCSPEKFQGKRVKMTSYMKSDKVKEWAGMWFRADKGSVSVSFDNMEDRPIKGNTEWKKCEIVLDVPSNATGLAYGVLLSGTGQVWFDEVSFEIVDAMVSTTGTWNTTPKNLNFEE